MELYRSTSYIVCVRHIHSVNLYLFRLSVSGNKYEAGRRVYGTILNGHGGE
jgi:hypothetical protein